MTLILAAQRDLPFYVRAAEQGRWATRTSPGLSGRTVLLLGVGGVGQAVEAQLQPFGPQIVRVAHTARDGVHGISELPSLLPYADVVVVAVRLDDSTVRLVDAEFLTAMREGALLVNVARGAVVDADALVAETSTGRRDPRCDPQERRLVRAQVDRMLAGERPLNVVVPP